MICVLSLIAFGVLGIFSVSFRDLAKEAFDCVFRKVTFRPCRSNFDERMKSKITAKVFKISPSLSRFVHKRIELLSWIFVILFIISLVLIARTGYLLAVHGTCNPAHPEECVFTPDEEEITCACDVDVPCEEIELEDACNIKSCACEKAACDNL